MAALAALKREEEQDAALAEQSGDPSKLFLLAASDDELAETERVLRQQGSADATTLFQELLVSHRIYKLNSQGSPAANAERARLLKQNLKHNLESVGSHERVLVKMGEWHLYKGVNPIHQLDLGNYIAEFADANGTTALHICVLDAKGTHSLYGGYRRSPKIERFVMDEDPSYRWLKPAIEQQVPSGWTVYDLRRLRFRAISGIDPDFSRLIDGYDLLVIIPELTPADMIQ